MAELWIVLSIPWFAAAILLLWDTNGTEPQPKFLLAAVALLLCALMLIEYVRILRQ